jgi:hypothetical protein
MDAVPLEYGIWFYRGWSSLVSSSGEVYVFEMCYKYPEGTIYDVHWKSTKAFNMIALIIGGIVAILTLAAGCAHHSKKMFQIFGMLYMVCCLFTGLLLLLLNSNACKNNLNVAVFEQTFPLLNLTFPDTCTMGVGAKTTISTTVLWFVAAIAVCMLGPTLPSDGNNEDLVKKEPVPVDGGNVPEQAV